LSSCRYLHSDYYPDSFGYRRVVAMSFRVVVDLNRCESYGQCVFAAPLVFRFHGQETLEYDHEPDDHLRNHVDRAAAACPVSAIGLNRSNEEIPR
jgi:ferredoxin